MRKLIISVAVSTLLSACGGSPTQPSNPPPPPTAQTFTLSGVVTESAPTTGTRIPGAQLRIVDNQNAGRTTTADGNGAYTFTGLQASSFTVDVMAPGYETRGFGTTVSQNTTRSYDLRPVFQTVTETLSGAVSGGSPQCGTTITRPCQSFNVGIHHNGILEATLTWGNRNNDLDLELWDGTTRLASSNDVLSTREFISSNVTGGRSFQLRVVYFSGSTVEGFQVAVRRPN